MLWIVGAKGLLGSAVYAKCKAVLHVRSGREVDIGDLSSVRAFAKGHPGITHIVNCAAFSQVDAAEVQREEAYKTNAIGPENLAKVAKEIGAKLIHISTDYVFSGHIQRPLKEEDPIGPCNYYGVTKWEGEQRALASSACVIRTSWMFGERGGNFVSRLLRMLQTEKIVRLTDDQWGRFTYASDLAEAIWQMRDHSGLYQYANAGITTKYEFGLFLREEAMALGLPIAAEAIVPVSATAFSAPCKRPTYSAFDTGKIELFVPVRHWKEALKEFLCAQRPASL